MMERVFVGKISNTDELTIKYLDDDGDKITLLNDSDLTVALHFHKILRLFVFVNGQERISHGKQGENLIDAKEFRNELKDIRTSVQTILDRLQLPSKNEEASPAMKVESDTSTSVPPENGQLNTNHEHPSKPIETQPIPSIENNQAGLQNQFQPPHFAPPIYTSEQQAKANLFGPPPTTFPPNPPAPRFPPTTTAVNNAPAAPYPSTPTPPPPLTTGSTTGYLGQSAPPQQGGFYAQQQATSPPPPSTGFYAQQATNFNPNNTFLPQQQPPTSNSSFPQTGPPPMAFQQPYGAYSQQNPYFNPYPK